MMTNKLIANKIKDKKYEKIVSLSSQTKNLFPSKSPNNDKILVKIKLKSPIRRVYFSKLRKNKTKEINKRSKMSLANEFENYKDNTGIINYNLMQPNNYLIRSNKLISNISNLNKSYNDKTSILPDINSNKPKHQSLNQTNEKFDLNLKKISLGDLSKNYEEKEENEEIKIDNKINLDKNKVEENKINKNNKSTNLKKLIFYRNSTDYKLDNNIKTNTPKINRNAKLLKKYYMQKMMNYDRLIKKLEEESENKKNIMNEYINLMKENFEKGF